MEVISVLHMNCGSGKTSYANNSLLQRKVITMTRPIMEEAVTALYHSFSSHPSTFVIADLGCSSGPNALFAVSGVIKTLEDIQKNHMFNNDIDAPEYQVFLNDLPGNDFNALFKSLSLSEDHDMKSGLCFVSGVPGSFYGRLFPSKSLHFAHSSYSLHWLSKVPEGLESNNKWNISMSRSSPRSVIDAYYQQFQDDFSLFLKHRGEEIVSGGRMLLTFLGRRSEDLSREECCSNLELLAMALNEMVSEGLIKEEKLHTFNCPFYTPSSYEVKTEVLKEGSFSITRLEVWEVNWSGFDETMVKNDGGLEEGYSVARCMRAVFEPMLISHFGEGIIEDIFRRYRLLIEDGMAKEKTGYINVTVSLTRRWQP